MGYVVLIGLVCLLCSVQYEAAMSADICHDKDDGEVVDSDYVCSTCKCDAGVRICETIVCIALHCPNGTEEKKDGQCCPTCKPGCHSDIVGYIKPGVTKTSEDGCTECKCSEKFEVKCIAYSCKECPQEVFTKDDTCCGQCDRTKCVVNGNVYENEEKIETSDPCKRCHCSAVGEIAEVKCAQTICPQCVTELPIEKGKCCGKCEDHPQCKRDGNFYSIGDLFAPNPCEHCECIAEGKTARELCSIIDCAPCADGEHRKPGTCCECETPLCEQDGHTYNVGIEVPSKRPCDVCTCQMSKSGVPGVVCEPIACAKVCPYGQELVKNYTSKTCCHCKDVKMPPQDCSLVRCAAPNCEKKTWKHKPEGQCCTQCKCKYNGKLYNPGPFKYKCKRCMCENGKVTCTPPRCHEKSLQCVDAVLGEDCCYHCPQGKTCFHKMVEGNIIKYGEYKKTTNGKYYCTCAGNPWSRAAYCSATKLKPASIEKKLERIGNQLADDMKLESVEK